jgi:hypothetical protein
VHFPPFDFILIGGRSKKGRTVFFSIKREFLPGQVIDESMTTLAMVCLMHEDGSSLCLPFSVDKKLPIKAMDYIIQFCFLPEFFNLRKMISKEKWLDLLQHSRSRHAVFDAFLHHTQWQFYV